MSSGRITESYCKGCGRMYPIDNFYQSTNKYHADGVVPYCKDCCNQMVHDYLKIYGSLESALWITCSLMGVPFITKVYEHLEDKIERNKRPKGKRYNYIGNYLSSLRALKQNADEWNDFTDTDVSMGEIKTVKKHEEALKENMKDLELDWGKQESIEDMQWLEFKFTQYTENIEELTPAQSSLYRRLCLVELRIRKKTEQGESVKDETSQMLSLMKTLKIDDFKVDKQLTMVERMLESQIAYLEEEEPAEHYKDLEKYFDFMGIKTYMWNHVFRPLKNLLTGSKEYTLKREKDEFAEYEEEDIDEIIERENILSKEETNEQG